MAAYFADAQGAVWGLGPHGSAVCVYDPADPADDTAGVPHNVADVTRRWGPLVPLPSWPPLLPTDD